MKRPIVDLTDKECEVVFRRLGLREKRLLLEHEVAVYASSALFRDVAQIICYRVGDDLDKHAQ